MSNPTRKSNTDDCSMDAERYGRGKCHEDAVEYLKGPVFANIRCQVRRAILDRFTLQPGVLKGEWRRKCTELTRRYQRQRCLTYEHAEAEAFEDVLCALWHTKKAP